MLILKGKTMKSDILNSIAQSRKCICFEYHDNPVCFESFFVDSSKYTFDDLLNEIDFVFEKNFYDTYFDYLLIYTNEKEDDVKRHSKWLEDDRQVLRCREIIITCVD